MTERVTRVLDRLRTVPPGRLLLVLVLAHVVLKALLYPRVLNAPLVGDEAQYVDGARAVSNLLRDLGSFHAPDTAELRESVVASGWFMPGMSTLIAPLYLVVPDAGLELLRAYTGVLTTVLLLAAALVVRRTFGHLPAALLLVFPGLVPMWLLFSYTSWGDLPAGLLVVVLLCLLVRIVRGYVAGEGVGWRDGAWFGLVTGATLYLRSSTSPLLVGLFALLGLGAPVWLRGGLRWRSLGALGLGAVIVLGMLLPWSVAASRSLDSRVTTTTTVGTALANAFGDRGRLCYGECDPDSTIWFSPVRYARETARVTGVGEVEVLQQMSAYARRDVTPTSYSADVLDNLARYAGYPAGYENWFHPGTRHEAPGATDVWAWPIRVTSSLLYYPFLALMLVLMVTALRRPVPRQVEVLALKLTFGALLLQPFVHQASTRYWPTFAPVLALGAVVLWRARTAPVPSADAADAVAVRRLWVGQAALAALFVSLAVVLATLALASAVG